MKIIPLTKGLHTTVSDEDYERLAVYRWQASKAAAGWYAVTTLKNYKTKTVLMHRLILDTPDGMDVDHKNGCTLDNRRENIRVCTCSQNQANRRVIRGKSPYKGVYKPNNRNKWVARIKKDGKDIWIGSFKTELEAAKAYDHKARELYGDFAFTNFRTGGEVQNY